VPLAIISNVMTNSELAIYNLFNQGLAVWTGLLFFWKIQSMQNYSVSETVINILMSLFAFLILLILAMITIGLSNDLLDFIIEIYQEVRLR
jgi:hypothetical protein